MLLRLARWGSMPTHYLDLAVYLLLLIASVACFISSALNYCVDFLGLNSRDVVKGRGQLAPRACRTPDRSLEKV